MADKSEILMKIVASGSSAIAAECALAINPDDQLMEGFEAGKFFQIKDFNFSAGLQDESGASAAGGEAGGASGTGSAAATPGGSSRTGIYAAKPAMAPYANTRAALAMMMQAGQTLSQGQAATPDGKPAKGETKPKVPKAKFAKWRAERASNAGSTRYPLEVEPVTFTRYMDQASTALLQALCDSQSLASASIVRRVATGDGSSATAYLRLDFTELLIVGIDWDDDDVIEEKFKFICRGVQVRFRPQTSDGTLGAPISGVWPAK
jgi:type VI protein secretion system component Hcp